MKTYSNKNDKVDDRKCLYSEIKKGDKARKKAKRKEGKDEIKKDIKELQDRIDELNDEIKQQEQLLLSDAIKQLLPNKCEYCGCYDGIHRTDCSFMRKY